MLFNMVLPGAVAAEEPFAFEYSGNFTDNRDADDKGTVRLNTSGTLTVLSGKATVSVYILGAGGGGAYNDYFRSAGGGGGGNQTVEVDLAPGTYEIVIGTGGVAAIAGYDKATGGNGGSTTAFGQTSTGGTGGFVNYSGGSPIYTAGTGGTPNGGDGEASAGTFKASGGSPNGGSADSKTPQPGGDGYVEITFI